MSDPVLYGLSRSVYTRIARYFAGGELTLADLHALPILLYFSLARDGAQALGDHPRLRAWLDHVAARPSVQRTKGKFERG